MRRKVDGVSVYRRSSNGRMIPYLKQAHETSSFELNGSAKTPEICEAKSQFMLHNDTFNASLGAERSETAVSREFYKGDIASSLNNQHIRNIISQANMNIVDDSSYMGGRSTPKLGGADFSSYINADNSEYLQRQKYYRKMKGKDG